ncbi:Ferric/cupric reductase transmembrane component 7 [Fusarium oxysporum f. sp. albedinis]|nr:Ferric/cupric reductase transmembrane component 7 [Fusarium oxysporum f. sp. albedinis]KAK2472411.1 hypothetical protein H9L39_16291 [Fusarium oxysporum f. sp. albedinis]
MPVMRQETQNFASPEFKSDSPKTLSTIVDCFKLKRVPTMQAQDSNVTGNLKVRDAISLKPGLPQDHKTQSLPAHATRRV